MPVREMAAMSQIQAKNRVAGLHHRRIRGLIGLRSRMRLHVRMFGAKEFLHPLARQVLRPRR